ncbi:MAG: type I secretion system permease/ATPase [Xanthobacteraceae bacterium]|nr:type I secretion system permease/ATPase [Xanthobacteraceae bacterium]
MAAPRVRQPEQAESVSDPLSDSLLYLAAHHGRALTHQALLAGLPITDGRLPVALYERAASRAGLEVEVVKRKIADIPALVLPAVLILRDGSTRILLEASLDPALAKVIDPSKPNTRPSPLGPAAAEYLGYAFLVRPAIVAGAHVAAANEVPRTHWFWSVVKRFWPNYMHVATAALLVNILALASPLFVMNVYDRVVPNGAIPSLIALSIGLVIAIVFDFVLRTVRSRIIDMTGKKLDVVLASKIYEHTLAIKMNKRPGSVGVLANQLRDFDSVRDFFTSGSVVSAIDLAFALLFIAVLFMIAGPLAWIPLAVLPIMILIGLVIQRPLDRAMKRLQSESAARHGVLIESLNGLDTVRATGAEARMQTAWERSVAAAARTGEDVHFWSSFAMNSAASAQQITTLLMVVVGVFLIIDGKLSVGALVAATMLAGRVLGPLAGIAAVITRASQSFTALKAIDGVMSLERERPPERMFIARTIDKGGVVFGSVTFKYPNAPMNALEKVSFNIEPGERVGIIGRIGSGKTTVGRLLTGFYDPDEGHILVDGVDLRQYDPADLRSGVGFLLQDTDLFLGKLRDNITLGRPNASDADVLAAARLAGVESFVASHPQGYDMPISEGGRSLSGGQKQAIGLARVLIRNPKILFLDEPTAHFDVKSEAEFLERLKELAQRDMTIIISTHRMSLLAFVDRLLVFDKGRLVADGPRDKVLNMLQSNAKAAQAAATPQTPGAEPIHRNVLSSVGRSNAAL